MEQRIVRLYLTLVAMINVAMGFFATTYTLFLKDRGLDLFEINLVNVVFWGSRVLFEIPTGVMADAIGRRFSFLVACIAYTLSMGTYYVSSTFLGFAFAECLCAFASTCVSGAFQAWLVDSLQHHGGTTDPGVVFAKEVQVGKTAGIASLLLGSFIGTYDLSLPWLCASITFSVITFLGIRFMKEDYWIKVTSESRNFSDKVQSAKIILGDGFRYSLKSGTVRFLALLFFFFSLAIQGPNMQWSIWFKPLLGGQSVLGWLWVGVSIVMIGGALFSKALRSRFQNSRRVLLLVVQVLFVGGGIFASAIVPNVMLCIVCFMMHEFGRGAWKPLYEGYLNQHIPSAQRATIVSMNATVSHIGGVVGLLLSGYLAKHFSIPFSWQVSGAILIISGGIMWVAHRNGKKVSQ